MTARTADKAIGERKAEREGNFEGAGYGNPLKFDVVAAQFLGGAARQLVGDVLVEAGLDDENRVGAFACHASGSRLRWPATFNP